MPRRPAARRPRRTWPQRLLITFNVGCIVAALAGAGAIAYAKQTVAQIPRVQISSEVITPVEALPAGEPQNFLIVGVDSDENLDEDDPVRDGRDSGSEKVVGLRSDTIMVVRIDPKTMQARILSLPRDLWVEIPGYGKQRINAAMTYGAESGPALLMQTIESNFGIQINHYVQVDFAAFKDIVGIIGGVKVYLAAPVRDGYSGLYQPNAGCSLLDEGQALAYARSRHLQYQNENGRWRSDPASDLSRIKRQQYFIRQVLHRAIEKGARNPATLARMIDSATKNIALDAFTTPDDLITLGRAFRNYDPETLVTDTLPVTEVVRGGADVLDVDEDAAEPLLAAYRSADAASTLTEVTPAEVTVRVVNGTDVANQATDTTDSFEALGFNVASPGADDPSERTEVRYAPGQEAGARLVARYLGTTGSPAVLVPDASANEVTVITGPDFFTVLDAPIPDAELDASSTTTTTILADDPTSTTSADDQAGESGTTDGGDETTTTTEPEDAGYLPGTPPPGETC